jgi:hypothetical protein
MSGNMIFLVLGSVYTSMLATGMVKNPSGMKDVMNPNLNGLTKLMSQPEGTLTAWTHMLALDLLAGRWMYLESLEKDRTARLPILFTLLSGPFGVLLYLATGRGKKKSA